MEEDASIIENQASQPISNGVQATGWIDTLSQCDQFNEIIEYDNEAASQQITSSCIQHEQPKNIVSICSKCAQLEIELQKSKNVVEKLKKRCIDKTAEIKRLRSAEKRTKMAKYSLEEILRDLRNKKWISAAGENVLKVI